MLISGLSLVSGQIQLRSNKCWLSNLQSPAQQMEWVLPIVATGTTPKTLVKLGKKWVAATDTKYLEWLCGGYHFQLLLHWQQKNWSLNCTHSRGDRLLIANPLNQTCESIRALGEPAWDGQLWQVNWSAPGKDSASAGFARVWRYRKGC